MKLTFRLKFLFSNLALVLLTMLLLAIVVIQGLIHSNIDSAQNRLSTYSNESILYIEQVIKENTSSTDEYIDCFENKSMSILENISNISNTRTLLYGTDGKLLTDSAVVEIQNEDYINEQVETALKLEKDQSVSVYKSVEDISHIYFASSIYINDIKLGAIVFIYSLESMDIMIRQVIMLFTISSIASIVFLIILNRYFFKSILKPIRKLVYSTQRVSQGYYDESIEYDVDDEIGILTKNFNDMTSDISDKISTIEYEKQKLSSIISSIEDGILAISLEKELILINDNAKTILNIDNEIVDYTVIEKFSFLTEIIEVVLNDDKKEIIKEISFEDRRLYLYSTLITNDKKSLGILFVVRDVTKLYALEEEHKKFISSVSHELRTPLTTIIGYSDLLLRRGTDNKDVLEKSLLTMNSEGNRLLRLVEDLLDLSKYQQTEFDFVFTSVDMNKLLRNVIEQMKIKSQKFDVLIDYNQSDLPDVRGDKDRLKQVFINILDNAIKYSGKGDIINVVATSYDNYVEISIRDYGQGISQKHLDRIFDTFYRIDEDRSREIGGTGLGLSIVKTIIDRHKGEVNIESQVDEGTIVIVKLLQED